MPVQDDNPRDHDEDNDGHDHKDAPKNPRVVLTHSSADDMVGPKANEVVLLL